MAILKIALYLIFKHFLLHISTLDMNPDVYILKTSTTVNQPERVQIRDWKFDLLVGVERAQLSSEVLQKAGLNFESKWEQLLDEIPFNKLTPVKL